MPKTKSTSASAGAFELPPVRGAKRQAAMAVKGLHA